MTDMMYYCVLRSRGINDHICIATIVVHTVTQSTCVAQPTINQIPAQPLHNHYSFTTL